MTPLACPARPSVNAVRRTCKLVVAAIAFVVGGNSGPAADDVFRSDLPHLSIRSNWQPIDVPGTIDIWSISAGRGTELWAGTVGGVASYDGTTWREYPLPGSVAHGWVHAVLQTSRGLVYALAGDALYALDDGRWSKIADLMCKDSPGALYESRAGDVWIGHEKGFAVIRTDGRLQNFETGRYAVAFCEDREGFLWWAEGDRREIYRSRPDPASIEQSSQWEKMLPAFSEPVRFVSLLATPDGRIWVGDIKRNDRLRYYDLDRKTWEEKDLSSLVGTNTIFDMTQDAQGRLWVCTGGPLLMVDGDEIRTFSPSGTQVTGGAAQIRYSRDNSLWLSRVRGGLLRLPLSEQPWRRYEGYKFECEAFGSRWFLSEEGEIISVAIANAAAEPVRHRARGAIEHPIGMFTTRAGDVWAVGTDRGAAAFSIYDGTAWELQRFPEFATGFDFNAFCERDDGSVMLGSGQFWDFPPARPGGVISVKRTGREWTTQIRPGGTANESFPDRVHQIVERPNGDIFSGGNLLARVRAGDTRVQRDALGIPGIAISAVKVDAHGTLWGGSFGKGVFRSRPDGAFEWFHAYDRGLDDPNVLDLAVLRSGDIVALTTDAVYRFDGERWTEVLRLPLPQPLPEGGGALKVAPDGSLWINLVNPAWYFRWSQGSDYTPNLPPQFSSLRYTFDTAPPATTLSLAPEPGRHPRSFSGAIEAWDPASRTPRRLLQYSFRIGDGPWTPFSNSPAVVLHELPEGRHTIQARARDLDFNIDPTGTRAVVTVQIPFWRESWFVPMLVVFAFAGVLVYTLSFRHRAKHVLELEQQKLKFFTNLSHEIRTPLSLVIAPLERATKLCAQPDIAGYLEQARRSSEELKRIVDQLLDFRRAQSGVMQSSPENTELVVFIGDVAKSFSIMAAERKQNVVFESTPPRLPCRVDVIKLQSVLNNLVLNGIRYSPEGASIVVRLRVEDGASQTAVVSVEDRGIGMDQNFLKVALKPFTRGPDKRVSQIKGTGIGLAYVNELMKICGGSMEIVSPVDPSNSQFPGTRVTVRFPIEPAEFSAEPALPPPAGGAEADDESEGGLPIVLLVEDDVQLGQFLCRELQPAYHVIWEQDGDAGALRAKEAIPDLIVTDRMMPKTDGFELCRRLRADLATAHIPILMLTAASSRVNELEALRAGVTEFLGKPFSIDALQQRLQNQLAVRDQMRAKLKRELSRAHELQEAAKIEDPFLKKAHEVVESELGDYLFDTDGLATKLGMSRSSLYRKMQATLDMSPAVFIRSERMRRAGAMLLGTTLGVAQVMEAVGITEQRTFNKWFKATFGCNPTEYRAQQNDVKSAKSRG